MDIYDVLIGLGMIGVVLLIMCLICLPTICTIIIGIWVANSLYMHGIVWWAFVFIFTIFVLGILGFLSNRRLS